MRGRSIDMHGASWEEIEAMVQGAIGADQIAVFYGHRVIEQSRSSHITPERLRKLAALAKTHNLRFYRMSELSFLDSFKTYKPGTEELYAFYGTGTPGYAAGMLEGQWQITYRYPSADLGHPSTWTWREDPAKEKYWRFLFYSLRPLRHLYAQYLRTEDDRYITLIRDVMESFVTKGLDSPHVWDKHTAGFLALSLVYFQRKLASHGMLSDTLQEHLPAALTKVATFLMDPNNYEWNNHGIAEALGLMLIAINFPELPAAFDYFQVARARFLKLLERTVDESGVQIEQSPFYHYYQLNALWSAYIYDRSFKVMQSDLLQDRIAKMVSFAAHIAQPNGELPLISSTTFLQIAKYQRKTFQDIARTFPLFDYVLSKGQRGEVPKSLSKLFKEGGFAVLSSDPSWEERYEDRTHVVFDVGPYRTGHSQLDALAVNLYGLEQTVFPDSGLYTYEKGAKKNYYFGTKAHNLAIPAGLSQKRGTAHAVTTWKNHLAYYQSGYHDLFPGFRAKRGVTLLKDRLIVVMDEVYPISQGSGKHADTQDYNLLWHLHPNLEFKMRDDLRLPLAKQHALKLSKDGDPVASLVLCGTSAGHLQTLRGEKGDLQGWHSEFYETEKPNWVFDLAHRGTSLRVVSLILLDRDGEVPTCDLRWGTDGVVDLRASWSNHSKFFQIYIQDFAAKNEQVQVLQF